MDRITTYQAALLIGLSPHAVQGYIASGKLRCWHAPSGHFQYEPADCAAFRRALEAPMPLTHRDGDVETSTLTTKDLHARVLRADPTGRSAGSARVQRRCG